MVLGLLEGAIEVATDKASYMRGETINCTCTLRLRQPVEARKLKAEFQRIEGSCKSTRYFDLGEKEIGQARTYRDGERFDFSFFVDENAAPDDFKFGGITGILMLLGTRPVSWVITVALDLPMKFDISGAAYPNVIRPVVQK